MPKPRVLVIGPAYLDRVVRLGHALVPQHDSTSARIVLDRSVDGSWDASHPQSQSLQVIGRDQTLTWDLDLPKDWPGPWGQVRLAEDFGYLRPNASASSSSDAPAPAHSPIHRGIQAWDEALGGMGAGYAAALGGTLIHALGPKSDPMSQRITEWLQRLNVPSLPIRHPTQTADWTLLISSGAFGDKLAIGFRGCHAVVDAATLATTINRWSPPIPEMLVVASWTNSLAAQAFLTSAPPTWRIFAPARRNLCNHQPPITDFANQIDFLCCNAEEWACLAPETQTYLLAKIPYLSITAGPAGAELRTPEGVWSVPIFPRLCPPRDTNRAGEAYAATLIQTLWSLTEGKAHPRDHHFPKEQLETATRRASAAAALVLDQTAFGFPNPAQIDAAIQAGHVPIPMP